MPGASRFCISGAVAAKPNADRFGRTNATRPVPSPRLAGRGLGRGAAERDRNGVQDALQLFEDDVVAEPKHVNSAPAEVSAPPIVVGLRRSLQVLAAVELDGQTLVGTIEVEDVGTAGMLAAEFETGESLGPQARPQEGLRVRAVATERAAANQRESPPRVFDFKLRLLLTRVPLSLALSPPSGARGAGMEAGGSDVPPSTSGPLAPLGGERALGRGPLLREWACLTRSYLMSFN